MILRDKDTPYDSKVELAYDRRMGEFLDALAESPADTIAQALVGGMAPESKDRARERFWSGLPETRAEREERSLWSGPVAFRSKHVCQPALVVICAWCSPGVGGENVSHTICEKHAAAMRAEIEAFKNKSKAA
jgi:hypothetical protein